MTSQLADTLPSGREVIYLDRLLKKRKHPNTGQNECVCVSLNAPVADSHIALLNGLRKILPFDLSIQ